MMDVGTPIVPWMLSCLRPHRRQVWLLSILLLLEVGLGAAQPWPFAWVIDHVLIEKPFDNARLQALATALTHGDRWTLHEHLGKTVVLLFYPGDNTPVCTAQLCSVRDHWGSNNSVGLQHRSL